MERITCRSCRFLGSVKLLPGGTADAARYNCRRNTPMADRSGLAAWPKLLDVDFEWCAMWEPPPK